MGMIQKGETIYTIFRWVNKTGDKKIVDAVVIRNNKPIRITALLSDEQYEKFSEKFKWNIKYGGFEVKGAGTDAGFKLVYELGLMLYNDGYAFKHEWL